MSKETFNPELSLVSYNYRTKMIESGKYNREALQLILDIPSMQDEELKELFVTANAARRLMFVMTGAAAYEIYSRAVAMGETFTTKKGRGITELFRDLSLSSGLDPSTLRDDFRIFSAFGTVLMEYVAINPEKILHREFYLTATKTPNPAQTLEYFEDKRDSVTYYTRHAHRDAKKFNQGMSVADVDREDIEERERTVQRWDSDSDSLEEAENARPVVATERVIRLSIPETPEVARFINHIIARHGSFREWLTRMAANQAIE